MSDDQLREPRESRGKRLEAARKAAGLSQEALAERLSSLLGRKVRQAHYSQWEADKVERLDDVTVRAIAQATGAPAGWLSHGDVSGCAAPSWWKGGGKAHDTGSLPGTRGPTPKHRHEDSSRRRKAG